MQVRNTKLSKIARYILTYGVDLGIPIVAWYLAIESNFTDGVVLGVAIGSTIAVVTGYASYAFSEYGEGEDAESYMVMAGVIQVGALLVAGAHALVTGNPVSTGISSTMVALYLYGLGLKAMFVTLGIEENDVTEDTDLEQSDDSEWKFE